MFITVWQRFQGCVLLCTAIFPILIWEDENSKTQYPPMWKKPTAINTLSTVLGEDSEGYNSFIPWRVSSNCNYFPAIRIHRYGKKNQIPAGRNWAKRKFDWSGSCTRKAYAAGRTGRYGSSIAPVWGYADSRRHTHVIIESQVVHLQAVINHIFG